MANVNVLGKSMVKRLILTVFYLKDYSMYLLNSQFFLPEAFKL